MLSKKSVNIDFLNRQISIPNKLFIILDDFYKPHNEKLLEMLKEKGVDWGGLQTPHFNVFDYQLGN